MGTQDLDAVLRELRKNLYKTDQRIQKQNEMIKVVQINMDSFTDAEESIEEIVNSNIESYEIRNEIRQVIKEVEEKIIRIRIEEQIAQSIQFATIRELKDEYDESTVEMGIVKPKSVGMTIQEIKPSRNMKLSELQIYDPEDVDEESEPICNEVMKPLQQIPLDNNCLLLDMQEPTMNETITYYDAVMEPTHYYLENMDQNNENYSDPLSHEDKNVLPMDSEYYLGVKKKTQQRIGRQVSFNLLTSQVLGYNEPCQWKQRNSTHMGPVHCVNRKRKKKRTSQGLSRIELQHVKMKNLQPSFNLMRMLIKYII